MRALIIGDGWVANNRHKPALAKLGVSVLAYDKKRPCSIDGEFDFAVICTPPQDRLTAIKLAAKYGIKQIYLEKPIATTIDEANEILQYCRENGVSGRSCHNFLFGNVGNEILNSINIKNVVFTQLNRCDRLLPKWVTEIPFGISLDEFPHFGYLARAIYPDSGLRSAEAIVSDSTISVVNRWQIEFTSKKGFVVCDLWRDQVYISSGVKQIPYWQYKEELSEGLQRIRSVLKRVLTRILFKRANDFGTLEMWRSFLTNTLSEEQNYLTSLQLSKDILIDFVETRD